MTETKLQHDLHNSLGIGVSIGGQERLHHGKCANTAAHHKIVGGTFESRFFAGLVPVNV
jgi:hypothetical protein